MPETAIDGVIGTIKKEHPCWTVSASREHQLPGTRFVVNAAPASACDMGQHHRQNQQGTTGALKDFNMTLLKLSVFMDQPGPC